jgi:PleD family two-component response regulator
MEKINILVICRHRDILQTILRLINNNAEWQATGAVSDEEALEAFGSTPFNLVLLGSGIDEQSENNLCTAFRAQNPEIRIVEHYGGGSGLLSAEIYEGLKGR